MNRRIHCAPISPAAVPQRAKQACWSMKLRRTGIWHRSPTSWRPGARPDCWPAARALHPCCRGCCSCPAGTPRRCRAPLQPHAGAEALAGLGGRRAGGRNAGSCVTGLFAGAGGGAGHRRRGGERGRGQNRRPHPDRQYAGRAAQASAGRRAGEHGADHGR